MSDDWVLDASMSWDGLFCFCPVEGDIRDPDGAFSIVVGMNFLGEKPPRGRVVALIHPDGQEAADAFYEQHKDRIDALLASPPTPSGE